MQIQNHGVVVYRRSGIMCIRFGDTVCTHIRPWPTIAIFILCIDGNANTVQLTTEVIRCIDGEFLEICCGLWSDVKGITTTCRNGYRRTVIIGDIDDGTSRVGNRNWTHFRTINIGKACLQNIRQVQDTIFKHGHGCRWVKNCIRVMCWV